MNRKDHPAKWILAALAIAALALSLLPVLYVAQYDFATGDDYAFGAFAHLAFRETHSVWAAVKASAAHTKEIYYTWQGTWLSVFLFGLQPEVFGDRLYVITPFIMVAVTVPGFAAFCHHFLQKRLGIDRPVTIILAVLILTAVIQLVPTKAFGIYWYNGATHYVVPYVLMLFSLVCGSAFLTEGRRRDLILLILLQTALGGMSYPAAIGAPLGIAFLWIFRSIIRERKPMRRRLSLLLPFAAELAGLAISAAAPGNKVRGGSDFGFSMSRAARTIAECFVQSGSHALRYLREESFLLVLLLAGAAVFLALDTEGGASLPGRVARFQSHRGTVDERDALASHAGTDDGRAGAGVDPAERVHSFPLAILALIMLAVWNASFYAPELYAGVNVSEGVDNTYYYSFVLSCFIGMIYCLGWIRDAVRRRHRAVSLRSRAWIYVLLAILVAGSAYLARHSLKASTAYVCLDFVRSGKAEDFRQQMLLQQRLLETKEKDVVIPGTNAYDGPLLNMSAEEDPKAWTSEVIARFYGKDSVRSMNSDQWHAMHTE